MGQLTIYFYGVCTHFNRAKSVTALPHRVVLVEASKGARIHKKRIPPHEAVLCAGRVREPLTGATVTVENVTSPLAYDSSYGNCIPSLSVLTPEPLAANLDVTMAEDRTRAAAHVDIHGGTFYGGTTRLPDGSPGAATAWVVMQTATDRPTLIIDPFGPEDGKRIELENDAKVLIAHVGVEGRDSEYDFLLHLKIAKKMPRTMRVPGASRCPPVDVPYCDDVTTVGPGCSNSNYP